MSLFNKLFRQKKSSASPQENSKTETGNLYASDTVISSGDNIFFKVVRKLSTQQKESIHRSTILLRTGQLYMHYYTEN